MVMVNLLQSDQCYIDRSSNVVACVDAETKCVWVRNTREDENLAEDAKRALFFQLPATCILIPGHLVYVHN